MKKKLLNISRKKLHKKFSHHLVIVLMDCDILVIGAGILGLSSAYHLKKDNPRKRVVVVDRSGGPGQGNSAKSEGAFRNVFTSETNFLLADSTIDWFHCLQNSLGYDLKLAETGYLWLFSQEQYDRMTRVLDIISGRGAGLKTFEKDELKRFIPDLTTDFRDDEESRLLGLEPVDKGVLGIKCGSIDADALVRSYEHLFLELGGEVGYGTEVKKLKITPERELGIPGEPFVWQNCHVSGAKTDRGEVNAETTVLATGVWSENLLEPIGLDPLMKAKKRQIFVFKYPGLGGLLDVEGFNKYNALPLTVLPRAGVYLKAELTEGSIWLGCADNIGRDFKLEDDPQPEEDYYTNNIYHILVRYYPCFEDLRPVNMWAGQYAINGYDGIPVVADYPGLIYVGAASGSGIMKCDALGRIVGATHAGMEHAELYNGVKFRCSDLGIHKRNVDREEFII